MAESYNIELDDEAKRELHKLRCFFKLHAKEDDFFDDFIHTLRIICQMPYAFQIKYNDTRIIRLNTFRYSIHYIIRKDLIIVIAILSNGRNY